MQVAVGRGMEETGGGGLQVGTDLSREGAEDWGRRGSACSGGRPGLRAQGTGHHGARS